MPYIIRFYSLLRVNSYGNRRGTYSMMPICCLLVATMIAACAFASFANDTQHNTRQNNIPFGNENFKQNAASRRRNFGIYLIGTDADNRLKFLNRITDLLEP